jgi:3-methyl-2-oxobutanoate hydroxymethyltransferase
VYQDALSLYGDFTPKFAKKFADVGALMRQGVSDYIKETKDGTFPAPEHTFQIDDEVLEKLY